MIIDKITNKERVKYERWEIMVTALDGRCNALRIEVQQGEMRFEETISVYDFVDIKKLLRAGKKLKEINEFSLLFVKLMISTGAANKKMQVFRIKDLPFDKVVKEKVEIEAKWGKADQDEEAKALALKLREDLTLIIPKLIVFPPRIEKPNVSK